MTTILRRADAKIMPMQRCPWPKVESAVQYHDQEWGVPEHDDARLFEFFALSGIQAGLSWQIVLNKRAAFRAAFHDFDSQRIARITPARLEKLLANPALVRNRLKLSAVIHNARCVQAVRDELGSLDRYLWQFVEGRPIINSWRLPAEVPTRSSESDALSDDLRRRGFKFAGSTICYAFMQSIGMVNDHLVGCFRHRELAQTSRARRRPKKTGAKFESKS